MARCASVAVTATDHSIFTSRRKPNRALPPLRLDLLPELLLLLADLAAGIAGREVRRLEDLADLHLGILEACALEPLVRLLLRLHLPEPDAGDQLLRLRERPVDHGPLACGETDASTLRARLQALAGEHHPRLHQLFVELPHGVEDLLVRKNARLRVLVGLHDHHETHRRASLLVGSRLDRPSGPGMNAASTLNVERRSARSTRGTLFFGPRYQVLVPWDEQGNLRMEIAQPPVPGGQPLAVFAGDLQHGHAAVNFP